MGTVTVCEVSTATVCSGMQCGIARIFSDTPLERDRYANAKQTHCIAVSLSKQTFRQNICSLQLCGHVGEYDKSRGDVITDEVIAHCDVFGEVVVPGIVC